MSSEYTPEKIIDGRAIAQNLRLKTRQHVQELIRERDVTPKLGVILVGDSPASQIYVKYKLRAAAEIGIETEVHRFSSEVVLAELYDCIDTMNADSHTHGILVQLPLPKHLSTNEAWSVVERVHPDKDVDGLNPLNLGRIGTTRSPENPLSAGLIACTPQGCLTMLQETLGDLSGKRAVVVGRSRIVGRPMAALLTAVNATVTVCHSRTQALSDHLRHAEIVIAAAGVPRLIKGSDLNPEAVVLDVGIHRLDDGSLCGDVDVDSIRGAVAARSPVPGGVGPMTIASLMHNVHLAALRQSAP